MDIASLECVQQAWQALASLEDTETFLTKITPYIQVDRVYRDADGFPAVDFTVVPQQWARNGYDIVHGGFTATLFAWLTTAALALNKDLWAGATPTDAELKRFLLTRGTTRALEVRYLQAVPLNAEVRIVCKLISNSKRNAFMLGKLYDDKGALLVAATHDKVRPAAPAAAARL